MIAKEQLLNINNNNNSWFQSKNKTRKASDIKNILFRRQLLSLLMLKQLVAKLSGISSSGRCLIKEQKR